MREKIFSPIVIVIVIIILSMFMMTYFFESPIGKIFRVIFVSSSLLLTFGLQTRKENKDMLRFEKEKYNSLYQWFNDLNGGHLLIHELLSEIKVEKNLLLNLKNAKNKILVYTQHDLNNLRLLKAYFLVFKEEKEKETYFKILISFLVGLTLFYIRSPESLFVNPILKRLLVFSPVELFISVIIFLIFIINLTYLGNKRVRLIEAIIEECINEKK
ncbi:hypothetical protein [Bacillus sp. Hm123]|uniref:hypothetical protein n=1 Tax=Bacillus sp. Hm123 TaxID=3450745 RepID=UPI003F42E1DA